MFRFTTRDLLWLMVLVGMACGWWISLGGEVCIHGSPLSPTPRTLGCVSLSPQDARDVYSILSMGSEVTVRR